MTSHKICILLVLNSTGLALKIKFFWTGNQWCELYCRICGKEDEPEESEVGEIKENTADEVNWVSRLTLRYNLVQLSITLWEWCE